MKDIPVADVRNFAIVGHTGSGKTALTDALAMRLGLTDRLGSTDTGSSVSDYTDEEKSRKISLFASPFTAPYTCGGRRYDLSFIDVPGFMDFYGQLLGAVRAADAALVVVDATGGVQVGTRRAWRTCDRNNLPARAFVVTGLDRENASFDKALESIRAAFGANCVPVILPAADGAAVVDVLTAKDVPAAMAEQVNEARGALMERAAETDDTLIEKFLAGEELSADELSRGLVAAVARGGLYPVFVCLPLKGIGVSETLDGICRLLPSPVGHPFQDAAGNTIPADPAAPFVGLVWRTAIDTFVGQLSFVRVISGMIAPHAELHNTITGAKEMAGTLVQTVGKKQVPIEQAGPGDIIAIPKLKATKTGHTLTAPGGTLQLPALEFPSPVMYMAIVAKTQVDEDKMGTALTRLCEQDSTLHVEKNAETKQVILKGLGDVHIDVAVKLMKSQSNVSVDLSTPKVPYRETVTALGEGHYRHKKQTGGRGQYGEVFLRVRPKRADDTEWFVDAVVGGTIPGNFMPAVQKGVVEGMLAGAVAGYPVQDVTVEVYDGSYHDVDSSEIAFKISGARALRDGMSKAKPVLLEPIMTAHIVVPEHFMGTINGDLNHRRGRILGMESEEGVQTITAEVPLAELFQYAAQLRSLTGGQGSFDMAFTRYDVVPSNIAQKIIAESAKHHKEETDE